MQSPGSDNELEGIAARLQSIQAMEKEKKDVLGKFMLALAEKTNDDQSEKIQSITDDLRRIEQECRESRQENSRLQGLLRDLEEKNTSIQKKHVEELKKLHLQLEHREKQHKDRYQDQQSQVQTYENELKQKNIALRRLEDECSRLRIDSGQYESRIESMNAEMTELHSAMASLHGELSALQRELDDSQKQAKTSTTALNKLKRVHEEHMEELETLRQEKESYDKDFIKVEQKLADTTANLNAVSYESKTRIDALISERESLQASLSKKDTKLKQQIATNQELNAHLGKIHSEMMALKEEHRKSEEAAAVHAESCNEEICLLRESLKNSEEANTGHVAMLEETKKQNEEYQNEISSLRGKIESMAADARKVIKRVDRIESEKQDLLIEISNKAQLNKELQQTVDAQKQRLDEASDEKDTLNKSIKGLENTIREKEAEIRQLQNQSQSWEDKTVNLERQLNEEVQLKEQAMEASRAQQKENANRIIESSQKNSKLTSDLNAAVDEASSLRARLEDTTKRLQSVENELDELKGKHSVASKRVQELEDQMEESNAKLDACEAEMEELRYDSKVALDKHKAEVEDLKVSHERAISDLTAGHKSRIEEFEANIAHARKQSDANLEKNLARARETFQRQLEEVQAARHREVNDARGRVSTLGSAMESLQRELREESAKNLSLTEELEVLRELVESGSSETEERLAHSERERIKERQRLEGLLAESKDQLANSSEKVASLTQQVSSLQKDLEIEKEARDKSQISQKRTEEKLRALEGSSDSLRNEVAMLKKQLKESDRKLSVQIAAKDEEIQRVTRRNEVLSEAVTRLTQMGSAGTPVGDGVGYGFGTNSRGGTAGFISYEALQQQQQYQQQRDVYGRSNRESSPMINSPRTHNNDSNGIFEDDSYAPPHITAPPPDPHPHTRLGAASKPPSLRSTSATSRSPAKPQEPSARALSAHHLKSSYSSSPSPGSGTQGEADDEVSASMLRVQRAIDSRRSGSTPKASRGQSAPTSLTDLDSARSGSQDRRTFVPASSMGSVYGGDSPARSLRSQSDKPLHPGVINAEYDSAYAQSAQSVHEREVFSPTRTRREGGPESPLRAFSRPPDIEMDFGPNLQPASPPASSVASKKPSSVPRLDMEKSGGRDTLKSSRDDETPRDETGGVSNRSNASGGSRDSYADRIREEVEMGKGSQLPYSPQKVSQSNRPLSKPASALSAPTSSAAADKKSNPSSASKVHKGVSHGGSLTERSVLGTSGSKKSLSANRATSAPPNKVAARSKKKQ